MCRSPQPLRPEALAGQDVVPEAEDTRLLELLRAQVHPLLILCRAEGCGTVPLAHLSQARDLCYHEYMSLWNALPIYDAGSPACSRHRCILL